MLTKENLERLFADDPAAFVASNPFWYPVPDRRVSGPLAPDVMVGIGRSKGRRGCYKQWEEDGIALGDERLALFDPTGRPFLSMVELDARLRAETQRADAERARADAVATLADAQRARADAEQARAQTERDRAEQLAARLRALGIEP